MWAIVIKIAQWFAVGGIPAFLVHAGLTVAVFSGLEILVTAALNQALIAFDGLPSIAINLALLAGVGTFFNIVGSALLTRVALVTLTQSMSLRRSS